MSTGISALREHLGEISDIDMAASVLGWDQQTYMPPGGTEGRAQQLSTLSRLSHTWFTSSKTEQLLDAAQQEADALDRDSDDACLVRIVRKDYERARKLPNDFVAAWTMDGIRANEAWRVARKANDFKAFQPHLEKQVDYARRAADYYGFEDSPYDALLDVFEPGARTAEVKAVFDVVRPQQVALVKAIAERPAPRTDFLTRDYPEAGQQAFALKVAQDYGYDLNRGRLDVAPHPFETDFGRDDVRITTRFDRKAPQECLYSIFHESGHAMYEQNIKPVFSRTPLDNGCSMVFHESQSRTWENIVGRNRGVVEHYFPLLKETFPENLADVTAEEWYRAVNCVRPSLIRTEADEVTYNLHVMLRFELEQALLDGTMKVADLPEAWNAKMQEFLGIVPPNDADGVLQDSHWSQGSLGYFPTYALGNILGAQIFETALKAHPEIPRQMAQGQFTTLRTWLVENVYQYGRQYEPKELALKVNGKPLDPAPYVAYLTGKYGELYGL
ncbi:MAG TPA: carboxypeptidase M32 [Armatimonadota bacterium]|jgi:carboxypeptidase Taq